MDCVEGRLGIVCQEDPLSCPNQHPQTTTAEFAEGLSVTRTANGDGLTLTLTLKNPSDDILHWGLSRRPGGAWSSSSGKLLAARNDARGRRRRADAVQRRRPQGSDHTSRFLQPVAQACPSSCIRRRPIAGSRCGGRDFVVPLPRAPAVRQRKPCRPGWDRKRPSRQTFTLDNGDRLSAAM